MSEKEEKKPSGDPPAKEPARRDPPVDSKKKKIEDPKVPGEPSKIKVG